MCPRTPPRSGKPQRTTRGNAACQCQLFVEDEEEDDDDHDEFDGTESRFPDGFLPMRMCRWFPSGNCWQGWGCMFAHSVSELHPWLMDKIRDVFLRPLVSGSQLFYFVRA